MAWNRRKKGYGRVLPTHQWQGLTRGQRLWRAVRWWLGAALLIVAAWALYRMGGVPGPEAPRADSERIDQRFVVCGQSGSPACVPDGDTLMIASRKIRILGIDAPELHPSRCPDEAAKGVAARTALLALLNQGPFFLTGPDATTRDDYGRELRNLVRVRADGSIQSIADDLVAAGVVRVHMRGPRDPWC